MSRGVIKYANLTVKVATRFMTMSERGKYEPILCERCLNQNGYNADGWLKNAEKALIQIGESFVSRRLKSKSLRGYLRRCYHTECWESMPI